MFKGFEINGFAVRIFEVIKSFGHVTFWLHFGLLFKIFLALEFAQLHLFSPNCPPPLFGGIALLAFYHHWELSAKLLFQY